MLCWTVRPSTLTLCGFGDEICTVVLVRGLNDGWGETNLGMEGPADP